MDRQIKLIVDNMIGGGQISVLQDEYKDLDKWTRLSEIMVTNVEF